MKFELQWSAFVLTQVTFPSLSRQRRGLRIPLPWREGLGEGEAYDL